MAHSQSVGIFIQFFQIVHLLNNPLDCFILFWRRAISCRPCTFPPTITHTRQSPCRPLFFQCTHVLCAVHEHKRHDLFASRAWFLLSLSSHIYLYIRRRHVDSRVTLTQTTKSDYDDTTRPDQESLCTTNLGGRNFPPHLCCVPCGSVTVCLGFMYNKYEYWYLQKKGNDPRILCLFSITLDYKILNNTNPSSPL